MVSGSETIIRASNTESFSCLTGYPFKCKIRRSPHPHARILNIDVSRAAKLPEVKAIVTGRDTAGVKCGVFPFTRDMLMLQVDKVRYSGDETAAVAAVDEETALEALGLISVNWEILPGAFTIDEALAEGAPLVHVDHPGARNVEVKINVGDVDAKKQLFEITAEKLECNIDDLRARDGKIFVQGSPDRGLALIQGKAGPGPGDLQPQGRPPPGMGPEPQGQLSEAFSFGATVAEVEVDPETGQVKALKEKKERESGVQKTALKP
ncbi:MAG: xanthine dehydrogenase family protein [Pseudomonadota bacterium]